MFNDFLAAVLIGLLGAGHCLGMCGGIASAITFSGNDKESKLSSFFSVCLYNLGRVSGYALAGAIFAGSIAAVMQLKGGKDVLIYFRMFAAVLMLFLALYISRLWFGLLKLEKMGYYVWRFIKPLAQNFIPLKHPIYAFPLGFFWGWLPCGLVYSTLAFASAGGTAMHGFVVMLGFGIGTLPAMISVGSLSQQLKYYLNHHLFRYGSGLLLALFAGQTFYIAVKQLMMSAPMH